MRRIFFKFLDKDIGLRRRSAGRLADGVNLIVTGSLSFVLFCCAALSKQLPSRASDQESDCCRGNQGLGWISPVNIHDILSELVEIMLL